MTKNKQVIIDGVDVSGCETFFMDYCSLYSYSLCQGHNCYYKQLKRTEIELEKYKKDKFCQGGCAIYQFDKIKELEQENARLKEKICKFDWEQPYYQLYCNVVFQRDRLKQENKDLVEKLKQTNGRRYKYKQILEKIRFLANKFYQK